MSEETLLSVGLALLVGFLYGALLFATLRRTMRESGQRMMATFLGGMLIRFVVLLLAVGIIVATVSVRAPVFLGVLVPLLIIMIALEVLSLMRHAGHGASRGDASDSNDF